MSHYYYTRKKEFVQKVFFSFFKELDELIELYNLYSIKLSQYLERIINIIVSNNNYTTNICLSQILNQRVDKRTKSSGIPLMAFVANEGIVEKENRYDREFLVKNKNKLYKYTKLEDFIYSSNNLDVGSIGLNRYGDALISDVYEVFSIHNDFNPDVVEYILTIPKNINKFLKYRQGVMYGQLRIHADDFLSTTIDYPIKNIEKIISELLAYKCELTSLIYSLVCELEKFRQYYLNKIFTFNY